MARRWLGYGLLACVLAPVAVLLLMSAWDLQWNYSDSMPPGLGRRVGTFELAHGRSQVVLVCPPRTAVFLEAKRRGYLPHGRCASGMAPLLKPVVALPGDQVQIGANVKVNGKPVAGSARLQQDGLGRVLPMPKGGRVPQGHVWVVSSYHAGSFDSCYVGAIPIEHIEGVMEPFWTWE